MPEEYTNRELGIILKNIETKLEEGFREICRRQDITNGNVRDNAREIENLKTWRGRINGALVVLNVLIVPIVVYLATIIVKIVWH